MTKDSSPASTDEEQLEKLLQARQEALQEELAKLKKKKLVDRGIELAKVREAKPVSKGKKVVEASWRDKLPAEQVTFEKKDTGKKPSGASAGYLAIETKTGETFLLKQFFKYMNSYRTKDDVINRRDGVQELIGSTMYQFLLYDRAPREQLVTTDKNDNSLYVRSKFFAGAKTLSKFSEGVTDNHFNYKSQKLKEIDGFEKVIAACHILGEGDYHAENMMVQQDGTVIKIDHGRSFMQFNKDFASMVESTYETFKGFGYNYAIENGNLTFDITKYSESLNQMVSQFSEAQIDAIVDQRVAELQKADFDPQGLVAQPQFSRQERRAYIPTPTFDELRETYKKITKDNLEHMREVAKQVEIVAKFSNVSQEFKNGGWLKAFAESTEKDPIKYAIQNDIKIDDKHPIKYAADNNIKIDGLDAKQYILTKTIEEYLNEQDHTKQAGLKAKYDAAVKEFKIDPEIQEKAQEFVVEKYRTKHEDAVSKYDTLTSDQKSKIKMASVFGLGIGGVIAYSAMKSNQKSAKAALEQKWTEIKANIEKIASIKKPTVPSVANVPSTTVLSQARELGKEVASQRAGAGSTTLPSSSVPLRRKSTTTDRGL